MHIAQRVLILITIVALAIFAPATLWRLPMTLADASPSTTDASETSGGWEKSPANPVLGGKLGTCFDVAVLKDADTYRMYFSWRPKASVALVESADGIHWSEPVIVLSPNPASGWEADINRPAVVKTDDGYRMWYTGQKDGRSAIGYAISRDGKSWTRQGDKPVLAPELAWEKVAVMCPDVLYDAKARRFKMWYSAGEQIEPDAIGYATSPDGIAWTKLPANPVFKSDPRHPVGTAQGDGVPCDRRRRRLPHVLHRFSRRQPRSDRTGQIPGRNLPLDPLSRQSDHPPRPRKMGPRRLLQTLRPLRFQVGPLAPLVQWPPWRGGTNRARAACRERFGILKSGERLGGRRLAIHGCIGIRCVSACRLI